MVGGRPLLFNDVELLKRLTEQIERKPPQIGWMSIIKTRILSNKLDYAIVTQREKTSKQEIGMPYPQYVNSFCRKCFRSL